MNELRALIPYLKPYRSGILAGLALVVIANAFAVATPKLLGLAVDALERPDVTFSIILGHATLIIGATILAGAARFGMRHLLNGISRRVEVDLRDAFFEHLLRLDLAFYRRTTTGDLMSRATNDTQAVRMAAGPAIMYLVNTVAVTAFALFVMVRISPALTAVSLIPMALMPPIVLYFGRTIHRRFERIQAHFGDLSTLVQENLAGARIVRAYGQERAQEAEFDVLNAGYLDKNMALARVSGVFHPSLALLSGLGMVAVLWYGGTQVIQGRISTGDFVAFGFYLAMLTWPMIALGWVINLFQRGAASMRRINETMAIQPTVRPPERPVRMPSIRGEIEFRNVRFTYPGTKRPVLDDVSFRIEAGQTVALVGPTGAGKSTVVALLTRLYDPDSGQVLVDGVPVDRIATEDLRAAMGVVPQDAFVFSETLADNLSFGLDGVDAAADRILEAARIAQLEEVIEILPHGLETRLGERGVNLSGGQRQRATLARALARDPAILVLDDALSAVDTHTESRILTRLRAFMEGRTALVVSHRVTAVKDADLILVLADGRIVEQGTYDELIRKNGVFASLLRRQLAEQDLQAAGAPTAAASNAISTASP
ncbi:MAG TPA: ABC transporter ATP-binding protein [Longimicrobiales bacterium]|nr:ABC transporter ATP-binding protein [Longimicrobiales bacterium]